jgi:hypothetical protein
LGIFFYLIVIDMIAYLKCYDFSEEKTNFFFFSSPLKFITAMIDIIWQGARFNGNLFDSESSVPFTKKPKKKSYEILIELFYSMKICYNKLFKILFPAVIDLIIIKIIITTTKVWVERGTSHFSSCLWNLCLFFSLK